MTTAIAAAGFDRCSVASNHSLDKGEAGVDSTLDALDAAGLGHAGMFPRPDGEEWRMDDWNNWRNRVFRPALTAVGLPTTIRPYDLRHSAASLWLHEGRSVVEVAQWLGHAPSMSLDTYGHVLVDLSDTERRAAEDEIRAARGELVPTRYLEAAGT
jgi:hypothetical protein